MGLFDKLFKKEPELPALNVADNDIVAIADGELIDVHTVSDPVFAEEMMGKSTAFAFPKQKVKLCAPANGTLGVLFPTGHAYGLITNEGVELLVHCGVDTVNANGDGFKLLDKKQGDAVKAGDPIVEVDFAKLSATYDMSTMLIITNYSHLKEDLGIELEFADPQPVTRGQSVLKK